MRPQANIRARVFSVIAFPVQKRYHRVYSPVDTDGDAIRVIMSTAPSSNALVVVVIRDIVQYKQVKRRQIPHS